MTVRKNGAVVLLQKSTRSDWLKRQLRTSGQPSDDETEQRIRRQSGFFGNLDHMQILIDGGVVAWNQWRLDNPKEIPDLSGINFTDEDCWRDSPLWVEVDETRSTLPHAHADLSNINFASTQLANARLEGIQASNGDFSKANFFNTKFDNAYLSKVDFSFAKFKRSSFSNAVFENANFSGADFTFTRFANAIIIFPTYDRKLLGGRCYGVQLAETISGDAVFKREILDQCYLDTLNTKIESEVRNAANPVAALFSGFRKNRFPWVNMSPILAGVVAGVMFAALYAEQLSQSFQSTNFENINSLYVSGAVGGVAFAIVGVLDSIYGSFVRHRLWALFDYGRDWDKVVRFGLIMILVFSVAFYFATPTHIAFANDVDPVFWRSLFASAMGYLTLGIIDILRPVTSWGGALIVLNVMCGYLTLGLLIAVLADRFSRRS